MTPLPRLFPLYALLAGAAMAAEPWDPTGLPPLPAVEQLARAQDLPVTGFALAGPGEASRPGDRLTVLFTIQEGTDTRQWLAEFRAAALTEREAKSKPGSGLGVLGLFQSSLKTDTGHEYSFPQTPAALEVRTFGPFPGTGAAPDMKARVLATRDYLVHGLAPMAEIELRLRAAGKQNPNLSFQFRPSYSDEQVAGAKSRAQDAGFTEADERSYAQGLFSLVQFANLAFRTDGVGPIVQELLDMPGLFTATFVNLDWSAAQLVPGADWGLPDARVFRVPYALHSKSEAKGLLFITAPQPPLQNMAGIIGVTIDETSKQPGRRLAVRVLAGRRGPP